MGIGGYTITEIIKKNNENNYKLLISEIKESLNSYYQECRYMDGECGNSGSIILGDLIKKGFLKGNKKLDDDSYGLVNPNNDINIYNCSIEWEYIDGSFKITDKSGGNCPKTEDYS